MDNLIFSLDIGTRSIIGLVAEYLGDGVINVYASSIREHKRRNMYDGQIHDIEAVARTVKEIVDDLENQTGLKLKNVSIAAAGRALKTKKIFIEKDIIPSRLITNRDIEMLDLEAIQKAQGQINENSNESNYYSIGHSVVDYYLNGDRIDKLQDHRGEKIGVELLVTFLPQIVVESLYSVIAKVGLEVSTITLEPIAAINIAIKEELRLLNLALVDIGAGTTDIAITRAGQIIAYAMTSTAGDEITEELARKLLLDFNTSEALKVKLSEVHEHEFIDIVGINHHAKTEEIVHQLEEIINKIALEISEKILEYNDKPPSAVFLLGGSSQMPGLREAIAGRLNLKKERVSIRDIYNEKNIHGLDEKGPHMITPVGIVLEGSKGMDRHFINIEFNGQEIKIFNMDSIKVSDVLVLTKFSPRDLLPKRGKDFVYYLNDEKKVIRGKEGTVPEVLINGVQASLQTTIYNGDKLEITESIVDNNETIKLYDILPRERYIIFEDRRIKTIKSILVNGQPAEANMEIPEEARIVTDEIISLRDFINSYSSLTNKFLVNGVEVHMDYILKDGDYIERVMVKQDSREEKPKEGKFIKLVINSKIERFKYFKDKFVFTDVFDYIDFDLSKVQGKLVLKINDKDAGYTDELNNGDILDVYWK